MAEKKLANRVIPTTRVERPVKAPKKPKRKYVRKKGKDKFDALGERLQPMLDAISSKIPPNVNIDVTKLAEMGLAGALGYYGTKPILQFMMTNAAVLIELLPGAERERIKGLGGGEPGGGAEGIIDQIISGLPPGLGTIVKIWWKFGGGLGISEEEEAFIRDYEPTDHEKILMALTCAVMLPKTPEILKGVGEIVKGFGEIIPF